MSADESASAESLNPYSAPEAAVERAAPVFLRATRMQRLSAFVLDASLGAVPFVPLMLSDARTALFSVGVCVLLTFVVLSVQLLLLNQNGWTAGKRALRIKIVRTNGERAGVGRIFWLRASLPAVLSLIPFCCVGIYLWPFALESGDSVWANVPWLALLVDPFLILGRARRCGHDYIADTIVVKA